MKTVLIAHQMTIPHYRVPFYNALERLRPAAWRFDVVYDASDRAANNLASIESAQPAFAFPTIGVKTYSWTMRSGKPWGYQTFWRRAATYDLIIVENALYCLTYPLVQLHQLHGVRVAYWGHGRDIRASVQPGLLKQQMERLKMALVRRADGFFAYTDAVRAYLVQHDVPRATIFVLNNTIDIAAQRRAYVAVRDQREQIRAAMGLTGKRVLLFVGRFTPNKRIDFLLAAWQQLQKQDDRYHLLLVGSGGEPFLADNQLPNVTYYGPINAIERLAQFYTAADLYVIPGAVGLGPLQALCYDVPIVTIDSPLHGPEIAYLTTANAVILSADSSPSQYAAAVSSLCYEPEVLSTLRANCWPSIRHLTIDNMAANFIDGVNTILNKDEG
ncbi:MAG: glycosyltransferase family 4 protein [Anaerolineae bacterium]|nr:glycosyltransferase family 4 protein [Anaerolineae bacterium]